MLISIIMPYDKGIHFLRDALDSIKHSLSGYTNSEVTYELIVVVDSGEGKEVYSKEALRLLEEYRSACEGLMDIKAISVSGDSTVAMLRNEGIRAAAGEYIYFMDSDDYILYDTFRVMAEVAATDRYDIITGPIEQTMFKYSTYIRDSRDKEIEESGQLQVEDNMCRFHLTILNSLIKRKYMMSVCGDGNMLEFHEENQYYCDMAYTAVLFGNSDNICFLQEMKYIKRVHNDSIQFPALDQLEVKNRNELFMDSLNHAVMASGRDELIVNVVKKIKKNRAAAKRKNRLKRVRNFFAHPTFLFRMIEKYIFRRLPMKSNWIVFESFLGKNYSDNCKYIYQYLAKEYGSKYRYIWVINDKKTNIPGNVTKVKYLGIRWFYYTSRTRYYVNNMRQPRWMYRREGSVMLETWHGTPLKKLVFDMDDIHAATPRYKMDVYTQSRKWTYLMSDNPFSTKVFESCFLYPKERIVEIGYPRNDILYAPDRERRAAEIKKGLSIPQGKKVILYAPTWRDDEYCGPGRYQFTLKLDLQRMKERLGDQYVILIRTHYFIADAVDTAGLEGFAFNVSRYNDIAELYLISDICITDYSSVFFDYANLRRPILFYVYDFEKYRDTLRGFYIDMKTEVPGPLLFNEQEVLEAIEHIDEIENEYEALYTAFCDRFCCIDDGQASRRACEVLLNEV